MRRELRLELEAKQKLECKVDVLSAMVAIKDEIIRSSEQRFAALKWEVLHNYHCDAAALDAVIHSCPAEADPRAVAPLGRRGCRNWRRDLQLGRR